MRGASVAAIAEHAPEAKESLTELAAFICAVTS